MRILASIFLAGLPAFTAWAPSANPDPQAILRSAEAVSTRVTYSVPLVSPSVSDAEKADATAQFVWFYDNAVAIEPSLGAVRQSFALDAWTKLGAVYPPAREQLLATRDKRAEQVRDSNGARDAFADAASINGYLKDDENTVELFRWLDDHNTQTARQVSAIAQPALVRTHKFDLCVKYLDADKAFNSAARSFLRMKKVPDPPNTALIRAVLPDSSMSGFATKNFANKATTIVALLTISGQQDHALNLSSRAEAIDNDPNLRASMKDALKGIVPEPWPAQP